VQKQKWQGFFPSNVFQQSLPFVHGNPIGVNTMLHLNRMLKEKETSITCIME
jgi:hypothetical protein